MGKLASEPPSGEMLVALCLQNRAPLVRFLYARLGGEAEAEDVYQDVYLKLTHADPPAALAQPLAYVYRVAANAALDHVRQRRRREERDEAWVDVTVTRSGNSAVSDDPDAYSIVEQRQRLERLAKAIDALPPQARRVFVRLRVEGATHAEIAAELGVSKSAIEKSIAVAMRHLLKAMDDLS